MTTNTHTMQNFKSSIVDKYITNAGGVLLIYSNGRRKYHPSKKCLEKRKQFVENLEKIQSKKTKTKRNNISFYHTLKNVETLFDSLFRYKKLKSKANN